MIKQQYFLDLEQKDIEEVVAGWKENAFRASRINEWTYKKKIDTFDAFSTLSKGLREKLEKHYYLHYPVESKEISRYDGTVRYNFRTRDGFAFSTVLLPKKDRFSVCLSTQIGCPVGCLFCATGKIQFQRDTHGEILDGVLADREGRGPQGHGRAPDGHGRAAPQLRECGQRGARHNNSRQFGIGRRHVTISTVGIVPKIAPWPRKRSVSVLPCPCTLPTTRPGSNSSAEDVCRGSMICTRQASTLRADNFAHRVRRCMALTILYRQRRIW